MKTVPADKVLYITSVQDVLCSGDQDVDYLRPCTHDEADACIILHAYNAQVKSQSHAYNAASKQSDKILICNNNLFFVTSIFIINQNIEHNVMEHKYW